jgi:anti-anti-sigma factor
MASASGSPSTWFEAYHDHCDPPTVYLSGELDMSTHDQLAAVLDEVARPGHDLVIDCTKLTFTDVHGVALVVRAAGVIGDGRMVLKGVHGAIAVIIDVLGLDSTVPNLSRDAT